MPEAEVAVIGSSTVAETGNPAEYTAALGGAFLPISDAAAGDGAFYVRH
jgi:hypothetical protein